VGSSPTASAPIQSASPEGPRYANGRAARLKPGRLWVRLPPWVWSPIECQRPGRQTGKAACLRSRCLRVRPPPGPLSDSHVRVPAWYANRQSGGPQTSVLVGSTPTRATRSSRVGWALVSPSGCNPPAFGLWRFNSVPTHWMSCWSEDTSNPYLSLPLTKGESEGVRGSRANERPAPLHRMGTPKTRRTSSECDGWHATLRRS
jgi:hypothetical protein